MHRIRKITHAHQSDMHVCLSPTIISLNALKIFKIYFYHFKHFSKTKKYCL